MSSPRHFRELLEAKWDEGKFVCVGLDSQIEKIPESIRQEDTRSTIVAFNRAIIDATKDLVCAYKPNTAFYESRGDEGWAALRETIMYIVENTRGVPVILDAKRGDIENSNGQYARAAFDYLQADAITVQPYAGGAALAPFFEHKEKGVFVWCRGSNAGSGEFQDMEINGSPLYKVVARHAAEKWNENGNCGAVVGGTYPKELGEVRAIVGDMPILVPGIGTQEGSLEKTIGNGRTADGKGLIVAASRSIIFASLEADFADVARRKTEELHQAISAVR
jgi:orotidine-5'-phosphate decarboxylase